MGLKPTDSYRIKDVGVKTPMVHKGKYNYIGIFSRFLVHRPRCDTPMEYMNLSYRWADVTCKKCLAKRKK